MIGAHLDQADLRSKLGLCLLTDEEMVDPTKWEMYEDPFPPSDFEDDDHDDDDDDEEDVSVDGFEIDFVTSVNEV